MTVEHLNVESCLRFSTQPLAVAVTMPQCLFHTLNFALNIENILPCPLKRSRRAGGVEHYESVVVIVVVERAVARLVTAFC